MRDRLLPGLLAATLALVLVRPGLESGVLLGSASGEAAGRLYVTAQVTRWLSGTAAWGHGDLLAWPTGRPFWPVDPLVQVFEVPAAALFGAEGGLTAVIALLLAVGGFGAARLARHAGAGAVSAVAALVLVQLSPFMLRNLDDAVVEVLAIGMAALAALATRRAVQSPSASRAWTALAAVAALAWISPYYVVYLALAWTMTLPWSARRHPRGVSTVAAVGALACILAVAPLLLTESGDGGRLGPDWTGGYRLQPAPLVDNAGHAVRVGPPPLRRGAAHAGGGRTWLSAVVPPTVERAVRRFPGGLALALAALIGLAGRRSRPWSVLALVFLLLGPGPGLVLRALRIPGMEPPALLPRLLESLPLTSAMGNPGRMLAAWTLLAATAGAVALRRRPWVAVALALLAFGEASLNQPRLAARAFRSGMSSTVLNALDGPTIVFPSGDPPSWHPWVAPKEVLALAGRAGVPVAYDFGRGGTPSDLHALVRLSAVSGAPIGRTAWRAAQPLPPDEELWPSLPFAHVLVLDDRLTPPEREALNRWLSQHATRLATDGTLSAWTLPSGFAEAPETGR
jgi:hypothetical protein